MQRRLSGKLSRFRFSSIPLGTCGPQAVGTSGIFLLLFRSFRSQQPIGSPSHISPLSKTFFFVSFYTFFSRNSLPAWFFVLWRAEVKRDDRLICEHISHARRMKTHAKKCHLEKGEAINENGNQNTAIKRKRERDKICRLGMNEQKKWEEERTRSNLKHDIKSNKSEAKDLIMSHDCLKQQQQMWRCDSCDKLIGFCFSFIRYCCFCCLWTSMKYCGLIHMHDSIGLFWNVVMTSQHILPNFALFHSFTHRSN